MKIKKIVFIDFTLLYPNVYKKLNPLAKDHHIQLLALFPEKWEEGGQGFELEPSVYNFDFKVYGVDSPGFGHRAFFKRSKWFFDIIRFKPDVIHLCMEPHSLFSLQVLLTTIFLPNVKLVYRTSVSIFFPKAKEMFPFKLWPLHWFIDFWARIRADAIHTVNEDGQKVLEQRKFKNIRTIIPQSIDLNLFKREGLPVYETEKLFVYAGKLIPEKGLRYLLKAFREIVKVHKSARLILIGKGPCEEGIQKYITKYKLSDNISLMGLVAYASMPQVYSSAVSLVLPSYANKTWKEYFGRVLIESMACGLIPIGTDCGEIPKIIGDGGIICRQKSWKDLYKAIKTIINLPLDELESLSDRNIHFVKKHYSHESIGKMYQDLYKRLE